MGLELLSLLDAQGTAPQPTQEQEGQYASWSPGTMDFLIAPVPADDQVHTVSKITALWGLPTPEEEQAAGMPHAMLGWTGGTESLADFLGGFVTLGDGDEAGWTDERLRPLEQYILSLRATAPLSPPPAEEIEAGEVVFREAGCTDCHGAPRGSGDRIFTFEEIGTDAAMAAWADPDMDGTLCCGMGESQDVATHGLKSPRLTGSSFFSRFLHNGSLVSLEQLLCLAERPPEAPEPHSPAGHTMGCDLPEGTAGRWWRTWRPTDPHPPAPRDRPGGSPWAYPPVPWTVPPRSPGRAHGYAGSSPRGRIERARGALGWDERAEGRAGAVASGRLRSYPFKP
jgi:hypothetical protein